MSLVKKCDRCGKLEIENTSEVRTEDTPTDMGHSEMILKVLERRHFDGYKIKDCQIDICTNCVLELLQKAIEEIKAEEAKNENSSLQNNTDN